MKDRKMIEETKIKFSDMPKDDIDEITDKVVVETIIEEPVEEKPEKAYLVCVNCGLQHELPNNLLDAKIPKNWITTKIPGININQHHGITYTVASNGPWCSRKCFLHWASRNLKGDE